MNPGYLTDARKAALAAKEVERAKNIAQWQARVASEQAKAPSQQIVPTSPPASGHIIGSEATPMVPPIPVILNKPKAELTTEELLAELFKRKQDLIKKADEMKLDADAYRVNIPSIRLMTEDKTPAERLEYIGNLAVATGVPIIIVLTYIGELYGFSPEIDAKLETLKAFYTVKEVINVKRS